MDSWFEQMWRRLEKMKEQTHKDGCIKKIY